MFSLPLLSLSIILGSFAIAQESHKITMTNNCILGNPVFTYHNDNTPQGPTAINASVLDGIAWLANFTVGDCESLGTACGAVEFILRNDGSTTMATIDETSDANQFVVARSFSFVGGGACDGVGACCPAPSACTSTDEASARCIDRPGIVQIHISFC
ncbi:hypothetical protein GLOTRDRAFT_149075 [Gloeophyllum trabeum ATCC 11539]|uniref:Glycopeptide n=1 Tax=Gloeophyllum trabeum (strain ATCC 11539 / FP-39264 / Madison 617) TaxID=670483 RepID=S7QFS0_GLOTA|nr:uncharacterized protein GLOTRDRAFT_149075 [Gloeophyllum trabeum ATCC 11539]EPQ58711.1 hypothetical protein GLOTRDRAFT_149075 [Gloeophyllum trabeum ATCC 11539]